MIEEKATKACRFCGEDILAVAVKCKHCGEMLAESRLNFRNNDSGFLNKTDVGQSIFYSLKNILNYKSVSNFSELFYLIVFIILIQPLIALTIFTFLGIGFAIFIEFYLFLAFLAACSRKLKSENLGAYFLLFLSGPVWLLEATYRHRLGEILDISFGFIGAYLTIAISIILLKPAILISKIENPIFLFNAYWIIGALEAAGVSYLVHQHGFRIPFFFVFAIFILIFLLILKSSKSIKLHCLIAGISSLFSCMIPIGLYLESFNRHWIITSYSYIRTFLSYFFI